MKRLFARLIVIFLLLIILVSVAAVYLNEVVLPIKVKNIIINSLSESTGKKVFLGELKLNIFKGVVLRDLKIYDDKRILLSLKEGACGFLFLPVFNKQIIIPSVRLDSLAIFIERKDDNTLNILEPFTKKEARKNKNGFNIIVNKIAISKASIDFQDDTLSPVFTKRASDLNAVIFLSLPSRVKFNAKFNLVDSRGLKFNSWGEYDFQKNVFLAKIKALDFSPQEFLPYYNDFGVSFPTGKLDGAINLIFKDDLLNLDIQAKSSGLEVCKDKIVLNADSNIKANFKYNLKEDKFDYNGTADILNCSVSGLECIDRISSLKGEVLFNNSGLYSSNLTCLLWGVPLEAKLKLADYSNPLLNLQIASRLDLGELEKLVKDKFNIIIPAQAQGKASVYAGLQFQLGSNACPLVNGEIEASNARLKINSLDSLVEEISGKIGFSLNSLKWEGLNFKYSGTAYKTSGTLADFKAPQVDLELSSKDLNLKSSFTVRDNIVKIAKAAGKYLNSKFSLEGALDFNNPQVLASDLSLGAELNLADLRGLPLKFKDKLQQIKPAGIVHAQANLKGDLKNVKSADLDLKLTSSVISLLGLKAQDCFLNFNLKSGIADIEALHLSLYDGTIAATGKMNLNSQDLPYWFSTDIAGIKIEKLKMDIELKDKDISGTIRSQAKINGFYENPLRLGGSGRIMINDGKLWELNLFKGMGKFLFARDFTSIVFKEGSCSFEIKDRNIYTDDLILKSNLTNISGAAKIGFDSSIDATLNIEVVPDVPLSGTFKDITTVVLSQAGKFAVIRITGDLKDPKYTFKPAVMDIMKGIKDSLIWK